MPTKPPFNFEDELPIVILLAQPYILPSSLFMPVIPPQTSVPFTKEAFLQAFIVPLFTAATPPLITPFISEL